MTSSFPERERDVFAPVSFAVKLYVPGSKW
jgi:hypothetical protein